MFFQSLGVPSPLPTAADADADAAVGSEKLIMSGARSLRPYLSAYSHYVQDWQPARTTQGLTLTVRCMMLFSVDTTTCINNHA